MKELKWLSQSLSQSVLPEYLKSRHAGILHYSCLEPIATPGFSPGIQSVKPAVVLWEGCLERAPVGIYGNAPNELKAAIAAHWLCGWCSISETSMIAMALHTCCGPASMVTLLGHTAR